MRAVVADAGRSSLQELDAPEPGPGQVLVRPLATGICGSDLHAMDVQAEDPVTYPPMVLRHEFCAEVLDVGPGTARSLATGSLVCSMPLVDGPLGPELVGLSPKFPGGFAERGADAHCKIIVAPDLGRLAERSTT